MIKAFCCFYNEAALVPFFLAHYHEDFVDAIHAIVDDCTDDTRALLSADPRVTIQDVHSPEGLDDERKVGWLNDAIGVHDPYHEWFFVLDADEFIYSPGDPTGLMARRYLASVPAGCLALRAYRLDVFRHETDADLDVARRPIALQRCHGINNEGNEKPIVIRSNRGLRFEVGNHHLVNWPPLCETHHFDGVHWQNADPSFSITRRVRDRKERLSANNLARRMGWHHATKTAEDVTAELEAHRHDARVL